MGLADRGAMQRQALPDRGRNLDRAFFGLGGLQRHHAVAARDCDEGALAAFARDLGQNRPRLPYQSHVVNVTAAEMEALDPEAIVLGALVLFDIAARLERGEQAEDVILMQLEPLGE